MSTTTGQTPLDLLLEVNRRIARSLDGRLAAGETAPDLQEVHQGLLRVEEAICREANATARLGRLVIGLEFLGTHLLALPEQVKIVGAYLDDEFPEALVLVLHGVGMPPIRPGLKPPVVEGEWQHLETGEEIAPGVTAKPYRCIRLGDWTATPQPA